MSCCYFCPGIHCLNESEQLFLKGCTTQEVKPAIGGQGGVFFVGPFYEGHKRNGVTLTKNQYLKVKDTITGEIKIQKGPCLYFFNAYEEETSVSTALSLGPTEYIRIENEETGELRVEKGPQLWFPGPYDKFGNKEHAIPLKHNQFVKILETKTGVQRVEIGEQLVFLSPTEKVLDANQNRGIKQAVNIDEHTAVLVRNTENGQIFLETGKKLFFPKPKEEIEDIRRRIVLEDHQVVIIKDKDGRYMFKEGKKSALSEEFDQKLDKSSSGEKSRSFFLPPYCELVSLNWYASEEIQNPTEVVTHFDMRPQFMTYEFICRTCDNVELRLDLTFFWEIQDIRKMIHKTSDLPSDICAHSRSLIIQTVSQVTLEKFMQDFNPIVSKAILNSSDTFYDERGAIVHTVEVRSIHCVDPSTEKVLQEIIKETTDRLNRLQKQASENEVRLFKMKGDIEEEKLNGELLRIRKDHQKAEAQIEGEGQADQIKAFLKGLDNHGVSFDNQVHMWQTLRKVDSIRSVAGSNSTLYFTPNDVNLSIETISAPTKKK